MATNDKQLFVAITVQTDLPKMLLSMRLHNQNK